MGRSKHLFHHQHHGAGCSELGVLFGVPNSQGGALHRKGPILLVSSFGFLISTIQASLRVFANRVPRQHEQPLCESLAPSDNFKGGPFEFEKSHYGNRHEPGPKRNRGPRPFLDQSHGMGKVHRHLGKRRVQILVLFFFGEGVLVQLNTQMSVHQSQRIAMSIQHVNSSVESYGGSRIGVCVQISCLATLEQLKHIVHIYP